MKAPTGKAESLNEQSLKDSEIRYRRLFEAAQDGILILDARTGMIEDVNPYLMKMLGYSHEEFVEKKLWEVGPFKDIEASQAVFEALQENEYIRYENLPLKTKSGQLIQVEFVSNVYLVGGEKVVQCNIRDITEHQRIIVALQENEKKYRDLVNQSPDGIFIIESSGKILTVNKTMCTELEFSEAELLSMNVWDLIPEEYLEQYRKRLTRILEGQSLVDEVAEYEVRGKDGKNHYVEVLSAPHYSGKDIIGFQGIARDITARKRAEDALRESEERFRTWIENSSDVVTTVGLDGTIHYGSPSIEHFLGYKPEELIGANAFDLIHPDDREQVMEILAQNFQKPESVARGEFRFHHRDGSWRVFEGVGKAYLDEHGQMAGLINSRDITERKQAEERIRRQFEHLSALSAIDRAIAANFDLKISLSEILTHVTMELGIDAADILILNSNSQMLEYGAEHGFRTQAVRKAQVRLGESYAGRAALQRKLVQIPNPGDETESLFLTTLFAGEDFVCYYGVPLITKGQVKGVLEVFHRTAFEPDPEWFDFLNALAGQAAIAIESSGLFESLQRSNLELSLAYDATIEGWSRALDLRDKETEGHSKRVTEMTVSLARFFGFSEADLVQVRWGSLLHDIGKMGVPDDILHKPGALTDDEWVLMKKHPVFAYELLAPIRHLRLALDIPYCHHEKWDGSGYPRGLKGVHIPMTARIFAVVDVWDALLSDRPYRAAWTEEETGQYIHTAAGTHFDPQVVEVFMQLAQKKSIPQ